MSEHLFQTPEQFEAILSKQVSPDEVIIDLSSERGRNEVAKKYEALVAEFNTALKNAIEPFEKAFELCRDNGIKVNIAEYLKNIYYRFSSKETKYEEGYKKYNEIVKNGL